MQTFWTIFSIIVFTIFIKMGRYYYADLSYGLYFLAALSSIPVFKFNKSLGLVFLYAILNGIYYSFLWPSTFETYGFAGENLFKFLTAQAALMIFMSVLTIVTLPRKVFDCLSGSLPWICIISSVIILFNCVFNDYSKGGIMGNSSMDPALIGPLYPTIFFLLDKRLPRWFKYLAAYIPILAILLSKGSVGLGALCISLLFMINFTRKTFIKGMASFVLVACILFIVASFHFGGSLFGDSHRFWIYQAAYDWWVSKESIWFGSGIGTYWGFGPMSQKLYWVGKEYPVGVNTVFTWMHSDWSQILFEMGIVGLILSLNCAFQMVKNCWKNQNRLVLACLMSYAGSMIFNMPLHWFVSLYAGVIFLRLGFTDGTESSLAPTDRSCSVS